MTTDTSPLRDFWADAEVISIYTRAQAIEDGTLVDVTDIAKQAGFPVPVALTRAAWAATVAWDENHPEVQDEVGRLWDVLWMAYLAARRSRDTDRTSFHVLCVPNDRTGLTPFEFSTPTIVNLQMIVGPGDTAEPVLTIMLPHED